MESVIQRIDNGLGTPSPLALVLLALFYAGLVIVVRWQMIAHPIHNSINARLKTLKADSYRLKGKKDEAISEEVRMVAEAAEAENAKRSFFDVLFWSRGEETAVWQLADKADSILIETWTRPQLLIRLATDSAQLRQLKDDPVAVGLADRIDARLRESSKAIIHDQEAPDLVELCELHREAVRIQNASWLRSDMESDYFNNKILWHIVVSLAAIVFVANIGPTVAYPLIHSDKAWLNTDDLRRAFIFFLLAGSVGGILSGLTRVMRVGSTNPPVQGAQGVSWMGMFLSPLVGGLAGWAGCFLMLTAHSLKIVMPEMAQAELWVLLAGMAVVLGFSERLFVGLAEKVEGNVLGGSTKPPTDTKGKPAPAAETTA